MHLLFVLAILAGADDDNARGFALYQQGKVGDALPLFEKAMKSETKSPFPFLNHARALALLNTREPDSCAWEKDWRMLAVDDLERGRKIDAAKLFEKLASDDKGNAALKKLPEVDEWLTAVGPLPVDAASTKAFVAKHPTWTWRRPSLPGNEMTLAPDGKVSFGQAALVDFHPPTSWSVDKNRVVLVIDGKPHAFTLIARDWAFDQGRRMIRRLYLDEDDGDLRFILGNMRDDCEY